MSVALLDDSQLAHILAPLGVGGCWSSSSTKSTASHFCGEWLARINPDTVGFGDACLASAALPIMAMLLVWWSGIAEYTFESVNPVGAIKPLLRLSGLLVFQAGATDSANANGIAASSVGLAACCWTCVWILLGGSKWTYAGRPSPVGAFLAAASAATVFALSLVLVVAVSYPVFQLGKSRRSAESTLASPLAESLRRALLEFCIGSNYNLMARMTTVRGEIVLSGSLLRTADGNDPGAGADWKEYGWKAKPGGINAWPAALLPPGHIPRLDWRLSNKRMPLGLVNGNVAPWFDRFVERIAAGSPDVLALLGSDPFNVESSGGECGRGSSSTRAPRLQQVRVQIYDYRFVGSRNTGERFMPAVRDTDELLGGWEHGTVWQRRLVKTVKVYTPAILKPEAL